MSNVISLHGDAPILANDTSDVTFPIDKIVKDAQDAELDSIIIIGDKGEELYLSSSLANLPRIIYLLELAKTKLLNGEYDEES